MAAGNAQADEAAWACRLSRKRPVNPVQWYTSGGGRRNYAGHILICRPRSSPVRRRPLPSSGASPACSRMRHAHRRPSQNGSRTGGTVSWEFDEVSQRAAPRRQGHQMRGRSCWQEQGPMTGKSSPSWATASTMHRCSPVRTSASPWAPLGSDAAIEAADVVLMDDDPRQDRPGHAGSPASVCASSTRTPWFAHRQSRPWAACSWARWVSPTCGWRSSPMWASWSWQCSTPSDACALKTINRMQ